MKESRTFPKLPNEIKNLLSVDREGAKIAPSEFDAAREWCISKAPQAWLELYQYLKSRNLMSNKQQSQCRTMYQMLNGKDPKLIGGKTGRKWLSKACKETWEFAEIHYNWKII
jgi:hypothetical protein